MFAGTKSTVGKEVTRRIETRDVSHFIENDQRQNIADSRHTLEPIERSRIIDPGELENLEHGAPRCCVEVRAPVSGRVLKRIQESESVVAAGAR